MKAFLVSAILLVGLGAGSVAADEVNGSKASSSSPPPMWTGFYAGLNVGGFRNSANATSVVNWSSLTAPSNFNYSSFFAAVPQTAFASTGGAGFASGGQVGYNWQVTDKVVVGVESDFQRIGGGGNNWNAGWLSSSSASNSSSWIGSVRGKAGYLVTPNLQVYGTGGFFYGRGN